MRTKWLMVTALGVAAAAGYSCRSRRDTTLERVAALEHEQWMAWSKAVASEVSPERRARWEKYWVPYDQLPEDIKEIDREWARKVIREVKR
jgi:hypothetical protein